MQHTKYPLIFFIALLIVFTGCGEEETILEISVTEHPLGGMNVELLTCSFEGKLISGDDPVDVVVEWWWEDEFGFDDQVIEIDHYDFDKQEPIIYNTYITASAGYVFSGFFWVEFSWTDDKGQQVLESAKAFCGYD